MDLIENEDGWSLTFRCGTIQQLQLDYRLVIVIVDRPNSVSAYLETPFYLLKDGEVVVCEPKNTDTLAQALLLLQTGVMNLLIKKDGQLIMNFDHGVVLQIDPDPSYEAWQLGGSTGFLFVCKPGGGLSFFAKPIEH